MSNKKKIITIGQLNCSAIYLLLVCISIFFASSRISSLETLCAFSLIDTIIIIGGLVVLQKKVFTVSIMFMTFLSVFHFGQAWLYCLGGTVDRKIAYDLFAIYSTEELKLTISFCLVAFNLIALFIMFFAETRSNKNDYTLAQEIQNDKDRETLFRFGVVLLCILIIPVTIYDYLIVTITQTIGHVGLYDQAGRLSAWAAANSYYPFAIIIILLTADKEKRTWKVIYYYAIIRCLLLMVLSGKRGSFVIPLLIYIFCKHTFIERIKKKRFITIAVCALVLLSLISYLAYTRGEYSGVNLWEFLTEKNIVVQILSELGSTLTTTILAHNYSNNEMLLGKSYLGAISTFVPFSDTFFPRIRGFISLESILNHYSPSGGALGGSIFGEMFINFRWWSLLLCPVIALIVKKIESTAYNSNASLFLRCAAVYFTYGLWIFVRGNTIDLVFISKRIIYVFLVYWMLKKILAKRTQV